MPDISRRGRADYGIDAPTVVRNFVLLAAALLILGYAIRLKPVWGSLAFGPSIPRTFITMGFWFGLTAAVMLWGSRFGKMRLRDRILDSLKFSGTEKVLDVGCGHGLMLIGAAKRLTTGRAYGIDIWADVDQAANSAQATMQNAQAEGVADKVEIQDGDARKIPFPDASFDVVVTSWVIHNMKAEADRTQAISEIMRVMKPGARLAITDISHAHTYAKQLRSAGMKDVRTSPPSFIFVIPSVTAWATKP